MSSGFLQDPKGNKSSKRLLGVILLVNGLILKNAEWLLAIFKTVANQQMMLDCSNALMFSGTALLGVGVAEIFASKNEKTNNPTNPNL